MGWPGQTQVTAGGQDHRAAVCCRKHRQHVSDLHGVSKNYLGGLHIDLPDAGGGGGGGGGGIVQSVGRYPGAQLPSG